MDLRQPLSFLESSLSSTEYQFLEQEIKETLQEQQSLKERNNSILAALNKDEEGILEKQQRIVLESYFQKSRRAPEAAKSWGSQIDEIEDVIELFSVQKQTEKALNDDCFFLTNLSELNTHIKLVLSEVQSKISEQKGFDVNTTYETLGELEKFLCTIQSFRAKEGQDNPTQIESTLKFKIDKTRESITAHAEELLQRSIKIEGNKVAMDKLRVVEYFQQCQSMGSRKLIFDYICRLIEKRYSERELKCQLRLEVVENDHSIQIFDESVKTSSSQEQVDLLLSNCRKIKQFIQIFESCSSSLAMHNQEESQKLQDKIMALLCSDFEQYMCEIHDQIKPEEYIRLLPPSSVVLSELVSEKMYQKILMFFKNFDITMPAQLAGSELIRIKAFLEEQIIQITDTGSISSAFTTQISQDIDKISFNTKKVKFDHDTELVEKMLFKELAKLKLIFFFILKIKTQTNELSLQLANLMNSVVMMIEESLAEVLNSLYKKSFSSVSLKHEVHRMYLIANQFEQELWVEIKKLSKFL